MRIRNMQTRLKLMIVDDEPAIRRGIATCIDWAAHGIEVVAEAGDGLEALEAARRTNPNIVITDVRMPKMDGLEFSRNLLAVCPRCRVLFLSGYAEFEYARQAISVGAFDYLLKPYGAEELLEKVMAVGAAAVHPGTENGAAKATHQATTEAARHLKRRFVDGLLAGRFVGQADVVAAARASGTSAPRHRCQAVVMEIDAKEGSSVGASETGPGLGDRTHDVLAIVEELFGSRVQAGCMFSADKSRVFGFVEPASLREGRLIEVCRKVIHIVKENLDASLSIGISGVAPNATGLSESYRQALEALKRKAARGRGLVHVHADSSTPVERTGIAPLRAAAEKVMSLLRQGDGAGVTAALQAAFKEHEGSGLSFESVRADSELVIASTMQFLEELGFDWQKAGITRNPIEAVVNLEFIDDLRTFVIDLHGSIARFLDTEKTMKQGSAVRKALQYIRDHFSETITLADMALATSMSPWYFSRQFSKETGETFVNWVNKFRVEKAKEIMQFEPEVRTYEIAERVGFSDYKHFSANFKKYVGLPPREYKRLPHSTPDLT